MLLCECQRVIVRTVYIIIYNIYSFQYSMLFQRLQFSHPTGFLQARFFFPADSESTALGSTSWRSRKGASELQAAVAWSSFYLRYPRAKLLLLLVSSGLSGFLSFAVGVILGLAIKLSHPLVKTQFRGKHFFHPSSSEMSFVNLVRNLRIMQMLLPCATWVCQN